MEEKFTPADLSALNETPASPENAPVVNATEQKQNQDQEAFSEFIDSIMGFVASIGLKDEEFKKSSLEYKQTASFLQIGKNASAVMSLDNVSPGQALILGSGLFAVTVVATREDLRKTIMSKITGGTTRNVHGHVEKKEKEENENE